MHELIQVITYTFLFCKSIFPHATKTEIKTVQNVDYVLLTTWMYFGPQADKHSTILENTVKYSGKC